jgi:hypothetical protein
MWVSFLKELEGFRFIAEGERPIHFSEFPVSPAFPQRFCNHCETSVLF